MEAFKKLSQNFVMSVGKTTKNWCNCHRNIKFMETLQFTYLLDLMLSL